MAATRGGKWMDLSEDERADEPACTREFAEAFRGLSVRFDFGVEYFYVPAYSTLYGRHPREFVFGRGGRMHRNTRDAMELHDLITPVQALSVPSGPEGER